MIPAILFFLVLALDVVSKYLTFEHLPPIQGDTFPFGGVTVFEHFLGIQFALNYATNKGAAWGLFADYSSLLLFFRIGLIAFLFYYLFFKVKDSLFAIPLALILAGAVGNVIDIFIYGHVIDMFHFILWGYDYPIFNVADSAIFLGVVLYLFISYKKETRTVS